MQPLVLFNAAGHGARVALETPGRTSGQLYACCTNVQARFRKPSRYDIPGRTKNQIKIEASEDSRDSLFLRGYRREYSCSGFGQHRGYRMGFRFRLGFRREETGGTSVQTADLPLDESPVSELAANESPVEAPAANALSAIPTTEVATPPAEIAPVKVEQPSPVAEASAAKSAQTETPKPTSELPAHLPARSSTPKNDTPQATPQADVEVTAELVAEHTRAEPTDWALEEKLASHKEWVESHGVAGQKANLAGANLEGAELVGVNLRYAEFHDANLKSADLLLADLRDACLMRSNLEESCLVGANLEGANLEGADLESAMGLVPRQLAGANLRAASLPQQIQEFPALEEFARASRTAIWFFSATMLVNILSWLMIWKTKDVQLITDSSALPFLHSSSASGALPTAKFYLILPGLLLAVYLVFQYHLQRLWDAVLELPAVFPDGRVLGHKGPWIIMGLLRAHFRWMNEDAPSTRLIEKSISMVMAYWIVPLTLLFFWGRYLTMQDMHGTALHMLFILVATAVAIYSTTRIGRPQQVWTLTESRLRRIVRNLTVVNSGSPTIALGVVLAFLSLGTIAGVPHDQGRAPQFSAADIRRWAPSVFWSVGYDPYSDLTEAAISTKPADWSGADDQLGRVKGAHLNNTHFRYAQAYGVFLVNSHLWRADFRGAFMSEADLRGADLGQANLHAAILDRAQMTHANLDRAELDGANLTRADLRGVNLSYASLVNATMIDARLDGASLYSARLGDATLIRASLEKTDFRDSHLEGAILEHADMKEAYLWSAKLTGAHLAFAQLASAIFIDANLRGADLHGAQFLGTVLTNADLHDSNLDGADLRGALSLNANQICSAKSRTGAQLDDALQTQVETLCGVAR